MKKEKENYFLTDVITMQKATFSSRATKETYERTKRDLVKQKRPCKIEQRTICTIMLLRCRKLYARPQQSKKKYARTKRDLVIQKINRFRQHPKKTYVVDAHKAAYAPQQQKRPLNAQKETL